jgi:hypothetical protein
MLPPSSGWNETEDGGNIYLITTCQPRWLQTESSLLWKPKALDKCLNLYNPDLILQLQGQALQYLLSYLQLFSFYTGEQAGCLYHYVTNMWCMVNKH